MCRFPASPGLKEQRRDGGMRCLLSVCTSSAAGMGEAPRLKTGSAHPADAPWQEAHQQADAEQGLLVHTAPLLHGIGSIFPSVSGNGSAVPALLIVAFRETKVFSLF